MKKRSLKRKISILLVVALVVTSFPTYVFGYANTDSSEPATGSEDAVIKYDPNYKGTIQIEDEITTKRGEFEKHFVQSDGSMIAVSYPQKVHYQLNGTWSDIDSRLEIKDKEKGLYGPVSSDLKVSLPGTATADVLIPATGDSKSSVVKLSTSYLTKVTDGDYSISWNILGNSKDYTSDFLTKAKTDTLSKAQIPEAALAVNAQPDISKLSHDEQMTALPNLFSTATYKNVIKNVDVSVTVAPDKLKENLIINSPKGFTNVSYLINAGSLKGAITEDNSIIFTNDKDEVVFTIPTPLMLDSNIIPEESLDIDVALEQTSQGYILTLTPDSKWMNDPARVYPVVLDPTVTTSKATSNILDTYIHSGDSAGDHKYSSYIKMNKTDGATCRGYIDFASRPSIDTNENYIVGGDLIGYLVSGTNTYHSMTVYQPTAAWTTGTITWANRPSNSSAITSKNGVDTGTYIKYTFPVDASVKSWYSTGVQNGYMIKYTDETIDDYNYFYAADHPTISSSYYPCMIIEYAADNTAPSLTSSPASSTTWGKSSVTLTLSATDTGVGVNTSSYKMVISKDGGTATTSNVKTYTFSTEGSYSVTASVKDKAGNTATKTIIVKIDKSAPVASSVTMKNTAGVAIATGTGTKETTPTVTLNGITDSKSGITITDNTAISYAIRKTGETTTLTYTNPTTVTYSPTTSPYNGSFSINSAALADGSYDLYVKVKDKAGNEAVKTFVYKKDTTPPTGTLKTCLLGQSTDASSLKGVVNISANLGEILSGGSGNLKLYRITGTAPNTTKTLMSTLDSGLTTGKIISFDTTELIAGNQSKYPFGNYVLEMSLTDAAGNNAIVGKNVEIKNQMLAPTLETPMFTNNNIVLSSWTKTQFKEITAIQYRVGDTGTFTNVPATSSTTPKLLTSTLPNIDGTYKVYAHFVDCDGLIGTDIIKTIVLDKTEPAIGDLSFDDCILTGPISDQNLSGYKVDIKVKDASDSTYDNVCDVTASFVGNPICQLDITSPEYILGEWYTIKVEAVDKAGNIASKTIDVLKTNQFLCPTKKEPEILISRPLGQTSEESLIRFSSSKTNMTIEANDDSSLPIPRIALSNSQMNWFVNNQKVMKLENGNLVPLTGELLPLIENGTGIYPLNTLHNVTGVTYDANGNPYYTSALTENAQTQLITVDSSEWSQNTVTKLLTVADNSVSFRLQGPVVTSTNQAITYQARVPGSTFVDIDPGDPNAPKTNPGQTITMNQLQDLLLKNNQIEIKITVAGQSFSGPIDIVKLRTDSLADETFHISNIEKYRPTNLSASDRINYKTYLRWDLPSGLTTEEKNRVTSGLVTFSVYQGTDADFVPGESNLLAAGITDTYYTGINVQSGEQFFYKVVAVERGSQDPISARSTYSSTQDSTAADEKEYMKRLGLKDHWEYAEIDTPVGDISIEKSKGNLVYEQVDATLPNEQLPVYLKRTYNSQSSVKSSMGYGWNSNFDMALLGTGSGNDLSQIAFKDENGTIFLFNREEGSDTQYISNLGQYLTLTKVEKTHTLQIAGVTGTTVIQTSFTMMTKDNTEYGFNSGGQLLYIGEPNGNFQVLDYKSSTGALSTVTTNKNLKMEFTYFTEPNGDPYLVDYVTLPDGTIIKYEYTDEYLTKVIQYIPGYENLSEGQQEAARIEYELLYDDQNHCLSQIKDAVGNAYSFEYDTSSVENNNLQMEQVVKATYPDGTYMTFAYTQGSEATGSSTITKKFVPKPLIDEQVLMETDTFDYLKGHILNSIDPLGKETSYLYNGDFLTTTTTQVEYQELLSSGIVETHTSTSDIKSESTVYDTDDGGSQNIISETDADGSTTNYEYSETSDKSDDFPTEVIERDINQDITSHLQYTYDDKGNVTSVKDLTEGTLTTTTYDANGEVASETESLISGASSTIQNESLTTYSWDVDGNKEETLTETADGKTVVSVRIYDTMGREISTTITGYTDDDPQTPEIAYSISCVNTYDGYGRLINTQKTEHKAGATDITTTETREYNKNGSLTKEIAADGIITEYTYDNMNQLVSITVTKGGETKTTTTTCYYEDVNIQTGISVKHVDNAYVTEVKNGAGDPISKTYVDPLGQTIREFKNGIYTDYTYSKSGDMLTSYVIGSNVGNATGGKLTAFVTDQNGNNIGTLINPGINNGQFVVTEDTLLTTNTYVSGNLTGTKDPMDRETTFTYDTMGRVTSVSIPGIENATTSSYDNIVGDNTKDILTDAKGNQRYVLTDALDQVIEIRDVGSTSDGSLSTTFEYDAKGNKTQETYGKGNYKTFSYDSKDRLIQTTAYTSSDAATLRTKYTYDSNDNLTSMVDYSISGTTETPYRYTYYDYDNLKRLVRFGEYQSNSPPTRTLEEETRYTYDIDDNLTKIDYPESVSHVDSLEFEYNANKWLTNIKIKKDGDTEAQLLRAYTYDRFGNVSTIKDFMNPGSESSYTQKTFTYDTYGRPVKLLVTDSSHGSTEMEVNEFEFDKASNIIKETITNNYHVNEGQRGAEVREYSYDDLDQLTSVIATRGDETISQANYTYDLVGNRLTETKDGAETVYSYNSLNQLTASNKSTVVDDGQTPEPLESKVFTYDLNGAQIQASDSITSETELYTFDEANRLATYIKQENGTTTLTQENQYNGADQRIKKTETAGSNPADVVNYFYQDGEVLYTTGSDKNKAFNILGAGDNIIATEHQDANQNASYFLYNKDLRGSTTNILDTSLATQVSYDYDWFGNTEITNLAETDFYNQICYTGGIYDESTKQYYLNARFYDPENGRFLSQDTYRGTLQDANSWNLYAYCANNPVKYSDPSGHFIQIAIAVGFAIWSAYDYHKEYKKAKKDGKKGSKLALHMGGFIVKDLAFGKVKKAKKIGKVALKSAKKIFKSKVIQKAIKKSYKSSSGRHYVTHKISNTSKITTLPEVKLGKKLDYIFGKATGSQHNIDRSEQMANQLKRIGIFDNKKGRNIIADSLRKAYADKSNETILGNGRIMKESLLSGPNGIIKMQSIWDGDKLITVQLFGKKG